uniref:EGF-like domain-containing protein n=2 Tax=Tetranychus urticae TaxID=32264 RepID=T1K526_TETUR
MFFSIFLKLVIFYCLLWNNNIVASNIIFANTKELSMVHLDSTRLDTSVVVDNLGDATALDFCYKEQIIFWSDLATEKIQGVRLGNKSSKPFDIINTGVSSPDGLACDWITKKIYWSDADTKRIEVVQFDGKNRKVLFWKDIDSPRALALVPQEGLLFWTDWGDKAKIERSSMDGKHRRILVKNEELRWPNGLAVDFAARRVYWTDGKLKYISSVDYNGGNKKMFQTNIAQAFGLTLEKDLLYLTDWTNMGISSCNKVSEKCKMLIPSNKHQANYGYPSGIKVYSPLLQPDFISNCSVNNGGCSHLCLLSSDPPYYSCACPTGVLLTYDNKTCAKREEKFIILLRRTDIRKISLDTEDHTDVVLPYPKEIARAISLDYDPIDDRIYWTDDDAKAIRRAHLNATQFDNVINSDLNHPDGIAVDWISRNLYWTEAAAIRVSRIDGSYRKTLISKDLDKPRAIIVNPWKGLMFWTDWGSDPKIERASLDGSKREKIIYSDIIWPNGLAMDLDEEKLFWADAKMDRIETCDFNGGSRKLLLDKISHPFGLTVLDDYVYWTDWHDRAIHRTDKRIGGKKEVFVESISDMMGLKAISLNQDLGFELDLGCYKNNGGCKHLCLDRYQKPFTCACANGWELDFDEKSCKRMKTTTPLPSFSTSRKPLSMFTFSRKPCPADRFACVSGEISCIDPSHRCDGDKDCTDGSDEMNCSICPEDKILCPSNPSLCLDIDEICDKHSLCSELNEEVTRRCIKHHKASFSSSSSSTSSLPSSSTSTVNNILKSTSGLPLYGVALAVCIVIAICALACRMTVVVPNKEPSSDVPLMNQNLQINVASAARMSYSPPQSSVVPIAEPPPDVVSSYYGRDSSRYETNSVCSGNESVQTYLCVPPPSPVTNVSVCSYATKCQSSDSGV